MAVFIYGVIAMYRRIYAQPSHGWKPTARTSSRLQDAIKLKVFNRGGVFPVYALTNQNMGRKLTEFKTAAEAHKWVAQMKSTNYRCKGDIKDTLMRVLRFDYPGTNSAGLISEIGKTPKQDPKSLPKGMTKLKFLRVKQLGLSQGEMAANLEVSQQLYSLYERGERALPAGVTAYVEEHLDHIFYAKLMAA